MAPEIQCTAIVYIRLPHPNGNKLGIPSNLAYLDIAGSKIEPKQITSPNISPSLNDSHLTLHSRKFSRQSQTDSRDHIVGYVRSCSHHITLSHFQSKFWWLNLILPSMALSCRISKCSPWRHSQTAPRSCDGAASAQARSVALRVEPAAALQGQCQGQVMWHIYTMGEKRSMEQTDLDSSMIWMSCRPKAKAAEMILYTDWVCNTCIV